MDRLQLGWSLPTSQGNKREPVSASEPLTINVPLIALFQKAATLFPVLDRVRSRDSANSRATHPAYRHALVGYTYRAFQYSGLVRQASKKMTLRTYPLSKLTQEFSKHNIDELSKLEVLDVTSPHALVQAAGYLKHTQALERGKGVFFRGQSKLYSTLSPSLLRGIPDGPQVVSRRIILDGLVNEIDRTDGGLRCVRAEFREPLLQHYGIRTTWLDAVDNIWIALWFACHSAKTRKWPDQGLHFEKRLPSIHDSKKYAYILFLASAYTGSPEITPGIYTDISSQTVDLRIGAPSQFLRPHAQHGLLVRCLSNTKQPKSDCSELHVGTVRIPLEAALDWLGDAATLKVHTLFPPAYYDYGYSLLINGIKTSSPDLGTIYQIQS